MQDGKQLKYGQIRGGEEGFEVKVATSQYIAAAGGKFVKRTGTNTATVTLATASDTDILGHIEVQELNSSNGTEVVKCVNDPTAVFRVPVSGGTYALTMRGKTCDLKTTAGVQGAALNSSSYDQLIIVNGDIDNNNWVDVQLNAGVIDATKVGVV